MLHSPVTAREASTKQSHLGLAAAHPKGEGKLSRSDRPVTGQAPASRVDDERSVQWRADLAKVSYASETISLAKLAVRFRCANPSQS